MVLYITIKSYTALVYLKQQRQMNKICISELAIFYICIFKFKLQNLMQQMIYVIEENQ